MDAPRLRIAMLGGIPALLGGGGLERQLERTAEALRRLGHDAREVHAFGAGEAVDVVHAFNHGGDVVRYIEHWRRAPAAFVFSPVVVVKPGAAVKRLKLGRHLPVPPFPARAQRDLGRKADIVVGLTEWERQFMVAQTGNDPARCVVIGNGVDPVELADAPPGLPQRYLVSVGTVNPRKQQHEIAAALAGSGLAYVVVGGYEGPDEAGFRAAVEATGGRWVGEIDDPGVVRRVIADANALVLLSEREGQSLALLEALAAGTPVVASRLPANEELAERHPGWIAFADAPEGVAAAAASVAQSSGGQPRPTIDSWDDVAVQLVEQAYGPALAKPPRTGQERHA